MFGLRITACLMLLAAGCGNAESPSVDVQQSALASCNDSNDCSIPGGSGVCVGVQCNNHACEYITDPALCAMGCTVAATDCQVFGDCNFVPCNPADATHPSPWCDFDDYTTSAGCQCKVAGDCTPNSCQQNPSCQGGTCTYTAKPPIAAPCCNVTADCGGTATCTSNICGCSGGHKFCAGASTGGGRCVPTAGCCLPTDCTAGNSCQARTCSGAGACGYQSNGNPGCCNDATADCGGTATCTNNTCSCGVGEKFCPGPSPGNGSCIPTAGCCGDSDCAARANATATCTSNACVYTCNSGFHDCSGVCQDDTSVASCGAMCTSCPAGTNACQAPACSSGACGFVAAGASPCCNLPGDCAPANACQTATACTNNECVFGSTGAAGCCNVANDCETPGDPCLRAVCVANQCATAPACSDDGGTPGPTDMAATADSAAAPDLSASLSLSGGGGCAFVGTHAPPRALLLVALLLVAIALRRRAA